VGTWQETEVINPQLDETLADQKQFADTVGTSTTAAQNMELYGYASVDSLRNRLRMDIDSFNRMRAEGVRTTRYEFFSDGKMLIHTMDGADSCAWTVEDDNALILDEGKLKGEGMSLRFEILALNDSMLKLQFNEKFLSSTTVFRAVKK
jgi:hypothetical protein